MRFGPTLHLRCLGTFVLSLSVHDKVMSHFRFPEDGILTKLSHIVFGNLPKCASKGDGFDVCCVAVLGHFTIFNKAVYSKGFGFSLP